MLTSLFCGASVSFAKTQNVSEGCTKILLVGNSYTYYNGLDQMLGRLGDMTGKDLLVVSAFKGGSDANVLLTSDLTYYAWYKGERIAKGCGSLEKISALDIGKINRAGKWDYVVLQNNATAEQTGMGDVYMAGLFTDMLESNRNFIINSNYWRASIDKDRLSAHYAVAKATGSSLIDTRGFFAQYLNVFKNRVWFRDLTLRDSKNHPSAWGTYIFALSVYAKIYGTEGFAQNANDSNIIPLYNSDNGNISEIFDTSKFKNTSTPIASITRDTATKLQYLVAKYAKHYLGDAIENSKSAKSSLPDSSAAEAVRYFDSSGTTLSGWNMLGGQRYYLKNGIITTGSFCKLGSERYYFNDFGETQSGWFTVSGSTYYALKGGSVATGWQAITDTNGDVQTFLFKNDGALVTGQKKIGKDTYYFSTGNDGKLKGTMYKREWRSTESADGTTARRYYNKDGVMLTGFATIKGKKYYFSSTGVLKKKQFITVNNKTYYADKSGVIRQSTFVNIDGKRYFFNKKGVMVKGKIFTFGKHKYYADKDGHIRKGWVKIGGQNYYFAKKKTAEFPRFSMYTGKHRIGGKVYKFSKNGVCLNK